MVFFSLISGAESSELVRVRILSQNAAVEISGLSLRFQNREDFFKPVSIPRTTRTQIRVLEKDGKKLWALRINGEGSERLLKQKFLSIQGVSLRSGARVLPDKVLLTFDESKKIDVVGVLPLEDYLIGVLSSEMPLSWPLATLKAQAIAARSYAASVMKERKNEIYHLESSILDQVFRHVGATEQHLPRLQRAARAVRETQNLKLYGSEGKILKAFFHSDCGGRTVNAKSVWNSDVHAGVAIDASCPTNPQAQWKLSLSKQELSRRLKIPDFTSLEVQRSPQDSRVQSVTVKLSDATEKTWSGNEFRKFLGFQHLRSSLFEVKQDGELFKFQGQGFGHGVGLCQWGSRSLGMSGKSYRQILKHYYPLAVLR